MAYILSIETATTNCSVALSNKGETLVLKEDNDPNYSHAESLHSIIDAVLTEAEVSKSQLDAIAVSKGPGSYTGLRIGVSAAKGLCYALELPLIAISTLEALAHQVQAEDGLIIPMLDARRMEVYSAIFKTNYELLREIEAQILDETSFQAELNGSKVYFVGSGVEKTKRIISHENAIFIENKLPSAAQMGAMAYVKYKKSDIVDVAYFEPFYLKDFMVKKKA
ncbi:tRNA (adenosine(37)-N6)-threonylcarbamoyltransferase complex dimerization subunit type 1 TsaB [Subsaximicrobium wynnwilliamsii]|uniref:tRNA (Adenosine(37)-N6)-threonylcarbamoyltransferase complex dimerization subunit type 1 TsaB n=1 Tax=Subsaximicrobium wynnwilliamsii TaxID=291179 RepID=A0A5C6ZEX4_9FLAO|nr:tRNA (adenosine(37)-N6)-threonylcarbamoyltransferase complex dimerization subunit type 1 TsaB [Subsaximicrobium wynnwilliamsii]TXD82467.1 tRNA (adenosine(37)-N6)-threonylcarbamoyltransferase complex dimerization subunit type 1 TsaB [Subsaximicrobium wynnwilliamsii]TXD88109.1 tRNA (adenosine(37)-N6)-threonylcarbamoyltransferase complex dimerization subunit type 1 TsaB [Subsaximicrobium wynnwilliamsii]TXE02029.1 tRNA (adenosine(37)-N6)-threonylcarbamoyltransferase complex dimerization subunit t